MAHKARTGARLMAITREGMNYLLLVFGLFLERHLSRSYDFFQRFGRSAEARRECRSLDAVDQTLPATAIGSGSHANPPIFSTARWDRKLCRPTRKTTLLTNRKAWRGESQSQSQVTVYASPKAS